MTNPEQKSTSLYMSKGPPPLPLRAIRQRWSHVPRFNISLAQLENMWAALGHADRLGLRPNVTLDIHFDRGDLADPIGNAGASLRAFLKSARQWIERKGGETAIIWALENRIGVSAGNVHAHLIMHVPPELLTRWHHLRRTWARKAGLDLTRKGVVKYKPLFTLEQAKGKLRYMSKDLDPAHLSIFTAGGRVHLDDRDKPSNAPVYGLKVGVSRNIGAKARAHRPGEPS